MATQEEVFRIYGSILLKDSEFIAGLKNALNNADNTTNKLSAKFEKIGNSFKSVGQKMTKVGTFMTATLTTGIIGLATAGIKYNAQLEDFQMNLTTLLGSSDKATKLLNDLKEMASTTPFETVDLIDATQTMIGFGISAKDSQKYLKILGDIAMGDSQKLSGLALAFSQVQSTGRLTGQDLLQMINQGFNPLLYISKMTGKSMAKLKEEMAEGKISAEMVADAFEYATQKGQPFYKAMENGAKTVNGRISTLKDNFMIMLGTLTESLLPIFEKVVNKLIDLTDKFSKLSDEQKENVLKWAGIIAISGPTLSVLGKLTSGVGSLTSGIGKLLKNQKVASKLVPLFTKLGGSVKAFVGACGGVASASAVVVSVLVALGSAIYTVKKHWEEICNIFRNFAERIKLKETLDGIKKSLGPLSDGLKKLNINFKSLGNVIDFLGKMVLSSLVPWIGLAMGVLNALLQVVKPLIDIFKGLWNVLKGLGEFIVGVFTLNLKMIKKSFKDMGNGVVQICKGLIDTIKGLFVGFFKGVFGFFSSLADNLGITQGLNNIKAKVTTKFKEWKDGIVNWFNNVKAKVIEKLNEWGTAIVNWFKEKKDILVNGFKLWWKGVKDWFDEKTEEICGKFSNIKNKVKKIMDDPNYLIELINGWTDGLNEWSYKKIAEITTSFEGWKAKITEWFTDKKETMSNGFSEWLENTKNWFIEKKEEIPKKFDEWKTSITNWFIEKKDTIVNGFTKWLENTKEWFITKKEEIPSNLNEWKTSISNWFEEKKNTFVDGFKNWLQKVKDWFSGDGKKDVEKTGEDIVVKADEGAEKKLKDPNFIQKLGDAILKFLGAVLLAITVGIVSVGYSIIVHLGEGLEKGVNWLKKKIPEWWNNFLTWLSKKVEALKNWIVTKIEEIKGRITGKVEEIKQGVSNKFNGMKTSVTNTVENLKNSVSTKFNEMKTKVTTTVENAKTTVSNKFNEMKTKVTTKVENVKTSVSNKFSEMKTKVSNTVSSFKTSISTKFSEIKTSITTPINNAKTTITSTFSNLSTSISNTISNMKTSISTKFNQIKTSITTPISNAVTTVSGFVENIKTTLSNFFVHIKTPHFKVYNGSLNPKDWITNGAPSIGIDWYAKAMDKGIIMNEPTAFGINAEGQLMAGGEAGSETIVGTNSLMNMIQNAVTSQNAQLNARMDALVDILSMYLPKLLERDLILDSGEVVGALTYKMDRSLGDLAEKRGRGR